MICAAYLKIKVQLKQADDTAVAINRQTAPPPYNTSLWRTNTCVHAKVQKIEQREYSDICRNIDKFRLYNDLVGQLSS